MIKATAEEAENSYRRFSIVSRERISPVQWTEITELTNCIYSSFHVAIAIDNCLFIHGGIKEQNSTKPLNDFHRIDMKTYHIDKLTSNESPYLSQHAAVVFSNKYIIFIGGWDGHSRTSNVHIFDAQESKWLKQPSVKGFPKGAGLSSHTANAALKSKSDFPEIIIIGREGSTRIQRRFGNAYRLSCDRYLTKFTYTEFPLDIDSRSGHCTAAINSKLFIVGGRDDKVIDVHSVKGLISGKQSNVVSGIVSNHHGYQLQECPLAGKRKAGRKGHCIIPGNNGFIVTGGSSFVERNGVANSAGFLYTMSSVGGNYYLLGFIDNARANGACVISDAMDAFYHGGVDIHGKVRSEILKLTLSDK